MQQYNEQNLCRMQHRQNYLNFYNRTKKFTKNIINSYLVYRKVRLAGGKRQRNQYSTLQEQKFKVTYTYLGTIYSKIVFSVAETGKMVYHALLNHIFSSKCALYNH